MTVDEDVDADVDGTAFPMAAFSVDDVKVDVALEVEVEVEVVELDAGVTAGIRFNAAVLV